PDPGRLIRGSRPGPGPQSSAERAHSEEGPARAGTPLNFGFIPAWLLMTSGPVSSATGPAVGRGWSRPDLRRGWFSVHDGSVASHHRPAERTDPATDRRDLFERLIEIPPGRVVRRLLGRGVGGRVRRLEQLRPVRLDCREQPARVKATR